ncbi:hypothetical protein E2562_018636 [Oryza meyeriana var. granulata]|uniref:Uncharacterized protein n=1 Tax=Oryza meyeriana var. granulata TaxID=110450 RepID=A0A6G1BWZ7_9ORYZ|nr:hypothetical protein E2562_018636 [Oryza meyeriana var. granulata]
MAEPRPELEMNSRASALYQVVLAAVQGLWQPLLEPEHFAAPPPSLLFQICGGSLSGRREMLNPSLPHSHLSA